jgi:hemerythrin-like domain-containing protein
MTEQVEHEHQVTATALDAALAACATWRRHPSAETGEALAAALDHLNEVVQPHLDDEEQKVVPLAAHRHGPGRDRLPYRVLPGR